MFTEFSLSASDKALGVISECLTKNIYSQTLEIIHRIINLSVSPLISDDFNYLSIYRIQIMDDDLTPAQANDTQFVAWHNKLFMFFLLIQQ